MIVAAWFTLVALVILTGFTVVGATFWHWFQQKRLADAAKKKA